MSMLQRVLAAFASGFALLALVFEFASTEGAPLPVWEFPAVGAFLVLAILSLVRFRLKLSFWGDGGLAALGAMALMLALDTIQQAEAGYWFALVSAWLFAWLFAERLSGAISKGKVGDAVGMLIPLVFGVAILVAWEAITRGGNVPKVLLPAPSGIWTMLTGNIPQIAADFQQTFMKSVLAGYVLGCGSGLGRPLAVPEARAAAARQLHLGAAADRHCADHGDVVRLRLAVEGGGGRDHDLLPHAGEHGRRVERRRAHGARPDAHLCVRVLVDAVQAQAAGGGAVHLQRFEDQLDSGADRRNRG